MHFRVSSFVKHYNKDTNDIYEQLGLVQVKFITKLVN